jgi:quinol monooxygenase YgiN
MALFITTKAQPGKREEIYELYQKMMVPHAEANLKQEVVVWCADQHDPDTFHLFEVYADDTSFGANAGAQFFADYMQAVGPLLAGEPRVGVATPRWTKGL